MLEDGEIDEEEIEFTNDNNNTKKSSPSAKSNSLSPKNLINNNNINNNKYDDDENDDDNRSTHSVTNNNKRKLKESNSYNHRNNKKMHKFEYNNNLNDSNNSENENGHYEDRDDRAISNNNSNLNSLMSINTNGHKNHASSISSWSTPLSKNDLTKSNNTSSSNKPVSLFDLVINPANINVSDPIITEKENKLNKNKPNNIKNNNHQMNDDGEPDESEMTISVESIEKKMLKKKKYAEIMKDKQKKDMEKQNEIKQKQQQTLCHFYAEGRCQKGDKCPFSHSMPIQSNKKLEICKYYLNGFCAKNEKCLYMHSEFPCKFFHRINYQTGQQKSSCIYDDQCRFSHDPITDPLIKEAFEKYLADQQNNTNNQMNNDSTSYLQPQQVNQLKKPIASLLGSPPISSSKDDMLIPSLMDLPIKKNQSTENPSSPPQSNNKIPSLLGVNTSLMKRNMNKSTPIEFKDVDERSINLNNNNNDLLTIPTDVDERPIPLSKPSLSLPNTSQSNNNNFIPSIMNNSNLSADDKYESIKKELIVKIMKAIADEDGGIFSQIPKNTLTELLVKLLNSNSKTTDNALSTESIITLLATLTAASTSSNSNINKDDDLRNLNESNNSSSNLQIDFSLNETNTMKRKHVNDEYDEEDEYDNCLVIEGNVGEFPYELIEIDIEPSKLWTNPPVDKSFGMLDNSNPDQECDPRIKYYSNKSNLLNVANFQLQMLNQNKLQQQQLESQSIQTPTSPNSQQQQQQQQQKSEPTAAQLAANLNKTAINLTNRITNDPRLASRSTTLTTTTNTNNLSPTRPLSPTKSDVLNNLIMPLLQQPQLNNNNSNQQAIANARQTTALLSQLADFQVPTKDSQRTQQQTSQPLQQQQSNDNNVVKLSIEDYKRKLQKPSSNMSSNKLSELTSNVNTNAFMNTTNTTTNISNTNTSSSSSSSTTTTTTTNSSLPSIPSYVVNLQAPQSLHELLKNFQS